MEHLPLLVFVVVLIMLVSHRNAVRRARREGYYDGVANGAEEGYRVGLRDGSTLTEELRRDK
jgi:hypothetical protein